jgi:hypothetical protein
VQLGHNSEKRLADALSIGWELDTMKELDQLRATDQREFAIRAIASTAGVTREAAAKCVPDRDVMKHEYVQEHVALWDEVMRIYPESRRNFVKRRQEFIDKEDAKRMQWRQVGLRLGFALLIASGVVQAAFVLTSHTSS